MVRVLYAFFTCLILIFCFFSLRVAGALAALPTATPTPDNNSALNNLQNKIKEYEGKVSTLRSQEHTLSSQIKIMDHQITASKLRISVTKQKIVDLEKDITTAKNKIAVLQNSIIEYTKALQGRAKVAYQIGSINPWLMFLASPDINNFLTRLMYLEVVQMHDEQVINLATQDRIKYKNEEQILQAKQQLAQNLDRDLQSYTSQYNENKTSKQTLLLETRGSESDYQKLLQEAKDQLAGFTKFTLNLGGASPLFKQTTCSNWGCYYNQRDSEWGEMKLNNTQYTLASDGCLITAMAMIYTHYGYRDVTPYSINSVPSNFASYYPAFLLHKIYANGTSSQRETVSIDSTLATGNPVVVGVHAYGGTHFVVLKSGKNGYYVMNDPFIPNGHDIAFQDHYNTEDIFEADWVSFNTM